MSESDGRSRSPVPLGSAYGALQERESRSKLLASDATSEVVETDILTLTVLTTADSPTGLSADHARAHSGGDHHHGGVVRTRRGREGGRGVGVSRGGRDGVGVTEVALGEGIGDGIWQAHGQDPEVAGWC